MFLFRASHVTTGHESRAVVVVVVAVVVCCYTRTTVIFQFLSYFPSAFVFTAVCKKVGGP